MASAADLIRRRRGRRSRANRSPLRHTRRTAVALFATLSLAVSVLAIGLTLVYSDLTRDLPPLAGLLSLLDPETGVLASPTVVTDRSGEVQLAILGRPDRAEAYLSIQPGQFNQVSPELINALVAAADPGYWSHPGFYPATLLSPDRDTIPLKLVSGLLFWQEQEGLRRSLRERILAAQVVAEFGREQVLEWYLNAAHFGHEAFGAESAARLYFGKSAARLSLAEAATLAAVAQTPDLNPFDAPELARARRDQTIQAMLELGYITSEEAEAALLTSLGAIPQPEPAVDANSAFVALVLAQVERTIPAEVIARGGLIIVSTLDTSQQAQLFCALTVQIERIAGADPGLPEDCETARLLPSLSGNLPDPSIAQSLAGEGAALDPLTGQVLALVAAGAIGPLGSAGLHEPGSLLTPYVYLTALTRGLGPASLVWDIPSSLPPGLAVSPNLDGIFHGPMRIRNALAADALTPPLQLLSQFGPATVWRGAALSGLTELAEETRPLILEGGALSLMEALHAYSAFSTQGVLIGYPDPASPLDPAPLEPTAVLRVLDAAGRTWIADSPPQARPVMSAPLAYALTHMLSDEAARWPSYGHPNVLEIGRPAGVKMGFTQNRGSVWTVGYIPQIAVGIWVGQVDADSGQMGLDPAAAAGVWHAFMKYATRDLPLEGWAAPQGIQEIDVCDPSGLLPTADCPTIVREIFLPGREPVQVDTLYRRFEVNRETGLLATVFTPAGLIEERVFFVPPPEAMDWARQAGYDLPPETYDLVSQPPAPSPDARLDSPQMFAYLSGEVAIIGSAGGQDFQSYSVQVGQGLNPQQWLQLGEPSTAPASGAELAVWDTAGLNGLYAVRLLVVRTDNLVETHILQVTVDNIAPEVEILYPSDGLALAYPQASTITVQLSAGDNLSLLSVDLFLDGLLVRSMALPPYALSLDLLPGEHVIRVLATDLAGNTSEVESKIILER